MKYRALLGLIGVALLVCPSSAQLRTNGYFSLSYLQGQRQSPFAQGSFQDVQAGLIFSGDFAPRFSYVLEIRSKDISRFEIEQAWAGFLASEAFQARVGLFLVPFGRYNESNRAFQTRLVEVPLPAGEIYPASWREIGIITLGKTKTLTYAAYLGNGLAEGGNLASGQQFRDNNPDKGRGGRVSVLLGRSTEIGVSYYSGKIDSENMRGISMLGADAAWSSQDINISGEYIKAEIENPAPYAKGRAEGFYVLGTVRFGSVAPLIAYQKSRYEDAFHGVGQTGTLSPGPGIFENRSLWAIGLTAALHPNVLLKAEYDFTKDANRALKYNVFRAQAAVHF
jgi:hypothetical protein